LDTASFCNQSVFDVYLGLTAAGYNLANPIRANAITEVISTEDWPQATLGYFGKARIDDGRVNPYWPRGSILTSISYLTECYEMGTNQESIRSYLETLGNIAPSERDQDIVQWAMVLPEQKRILRCSSRYSAIFFEYAKTIEREVGKNGYSYSQRVDSAKSKLARLLPSLSLSVCTVLNPLQADELVDIVEISNSVCVITSRLRPEAYVHELVHVHIDALLKEWVPIISARKHLLDAVYESMLYSSYAWDRSASSWVNVFIETLVRCLTAWILVGNAPASIEKQVCTMVREGFLYAHPVFEAIVLARQPLTEQWLVDCLDACEAANANSAFH
jgi:hypothetical protein